MPLALRRMSCWDASSLLHSTSRPLQGPLDISSGCPPSPGSSLLRRRAAWRPPGALRLGTPEAKEGMLVRQIKFKKTLLGQHNTAQTAEGKWRTYQGCKKQLPAALASGPSKLPKRSPGTSTHGRQRLDSRRSSTSSLETLPAFSLRSCSENLLPTSPGPRTLALARPCGQRLLVSRNFSSTGARRAPCGERRCWSWGAVRGW